MLIDDLQAQVHAHHLQLQLMQNENGCARIDATCSDTLQSWSKTAALLRQMQLPRECHPLNRRTTSTGDSRTISGSCSCCSCKPMVCVKIMYDTFVLDSVDYVWQLQCCRRALGCHSSFGCYNGVVPLVTTLCFQLEKKNL